LAEAIAGLRYSSSGLSEPVANEAFLKLQKELVESRQPDELVAWRKVFMDVLVSASR
jgi:hypothetical protein